MTGDETMAILRRARAIWTEREKTFPRFVQQTWEQGTSTARLATIIQAEAEFARDSGRLPEGEDSRSEAECEASQSGAEGNRPTSTGDLP
jgi:hypothetical protein